MGMQSFVLILLYSIWVLPAHALQCGQSLASQESGAGLQELAWKALLSGDQASSQKREAQILESFRHPEEIIEMIPFDASTSDIFDVQFKNGLKAIFKPNPEFWKDARKAKKQGFTANPIAEVDAYRISVLLELGLVPVALEVEVSGMKGTLHAAVHSLWEEPMLGQNVLKLFSYLINNRDVGSRNTLNIEGRAISIDHGLSFLPHQFHGLSAFYWDPSIKFTKDTQVFLKNLKIKLSPDRIRQMLEGRHSAQVIEELIQRRDIILQKARAFLAKIYMGKNSAA